MMTIHRVLSVFIVFAGVVSAAETPPPINFEAAYADGVNAFVARRYALAEEALEDAVQVGADPAAWMFKGLAERALGKHGEAQESIHQAAALRAAGSTGRLSYNRAMERIQGDLRLYIDDVEKYYVRTGHTLGEVIPGAEAPVVPAEPGVIPPMTPVPPMRPSPPPPAPGLETPDAAAPPKPNLDTPDAPAPPKPKLDGPLPTPPSPPQRITAVKPVVEAEGSLGVRTVIAGAPVYPLPGVPYAPERMTSVVAIGGGYAMPLPVSSCCVGVGAWLPASWTAYPYAYPYYGYYGWYSWPGWYRGYGWWDGYPYASW